jgi:hypothetical protein
MPSPFDAVGPDDLSVAGFDEEMAEDEGVDAVAEPPSPVVEHKPTEGPAPRPATAGTVDDLVASVLEGTLAAAGMTDPATEEAAETGAPEAEVESPPAEVEPSTTAEVEPQEPAEVEPQEPEPAMPAAEPQEPAVEPSPVTVGEGDPFNVPPDDTGGGPGSYVLSPAGPAASDGAPDGIVKVGDNQLHLRLQGTGAIAESGQVRALDIEVPVPGSWVGNRRVTLQLRLTLTPVSEDEDGGAGGAS